ncbi:MAG: transposase [Patescibacteria group bacterium]
MPARNSRKIYSDGGTYHVYNRGVEKRIIFEDEQDYKVMLNYLKEYLSPISKNDIVKTTFLIRNSSYVGFKRKPKNYNNQLELLAYCLMPNHFHLILRVDKGGVLKKFMQSLLTRYSMYFNKKHNRVGSLFQGRYKAVLVNEEIYLLHLSRYIHLNPYEYTKDLLESYSSYDDYLGVRDTKWLNKKIILAYFNNKVLPDFKKINSYKKFVENYKKDSSTILGRLVIEEL